MSKIRVLMCPADRAPYITNIENSLKNMQDAVGGYIEAVTLKYKPQIILICNEEGRINGLPLNKSTPHPEVFGIGGENLHICGDCFLCGAIGEEFADLPEPYKDLLHSAKEQWRKTC